MSKNSMFNICDDNWASVVYILWGSTITRSCPERICCTSVTKYLVKSTHSTSVIVLLLQCRFKGLVCIVRGGGGNKSPVLTRLSCTLVHCNIITITTVKMARSPILRRAFTHLFHRESISYALWRCLMVTGFQLNTFQLQMRLMLQALSDLNAPQLQRPL